jgi:hypothetical protein
MQVLVVEVVQHETEHDHVRLHGEAVELQELQLLIRGVSGNPRVDRLDPRPGQAEVADQVLAHHLGVEPTFGGVPEVDQGVAQEEDAKRTLGLRAHLGVPQAQAVAAISLGEAPHERAVLLGEVGKNRRGLGEGWGIEVPAAVQLSDAERQDHRRDHRERTRDPRPHAA